MTLNLPLMHFVWTEEYCQTSQNKNKSPNLWHVTSILVCCIFDHYIVKGKQRSEQRPPGLFTKLISTSVSMTAGINFGGKNFPPLKVSCVNSQLWWLSSMRNPWEKLSCPKTFRASDSKWKRFAMSTRQLKKGPTRRKKWNGLCGREQRSFFEWWR